MQDGPRPLHGQTGTGEYRRAALGGRDGIHHARHRRLRQKNDLVVLHQSNDGLADDSVVGLQVT